MNYTTADYLEQLQQDKSDLVDNLTTKGISGLTGDETFTELVPEVLNIPSGGSSEPVIEKDVNFYDYDGTLLHSYTTQEFLALTEMPANPTHTGLTAEGWNWDLANAKTELQDTGKILIGQTYITNDEKTRIYVTLTKNLLNPSLRVSGSGTIVINWGDGNSETQAVSSGMQTLSEFPHTYSTAGDYIITIEVIDGDIYFYNNQSTDGNVSKVIYNATYPQQYANTITKVEMGTVKILYGHVFSECRNLRTITLSSKSNGTPTTDKLFSRGFYDCWNLKCFIFPKDYGVNSNYTFYNCYTLKRVIYSQSLSTLNINYISTNYTFNNCGSLEELVFPRFNRTQNSVYFSGYGLQYCNNLKYIYAKTAQASGYNSIFNCTSLKKIIGTLYLASGSSINNLLTNCTNLEEITLASDSSALVNSVFSNKTLIKYAKIPSTVTSIPSNCFAGCSSLEVIDFTSNTSIPTLANTNFIDNTPAYLKIVVPDNLYENWIAANNWSNNNIVSHIVKASEA